jgi:aerobic carbon-monoxide dehydrogenase small subunit
MENLYVEHEQSNGPFGAKGVGESSMFCISPAVANATPGFILMTTKLLEEHSDPDEETIKHYLTGNLCRCAAYPEVLDAVRLAVRNRKARASA